ncbi:MAG: DUF3142 domain-containing protein [Candidatus Hydrogenedentes bacterium]|nr:DUF3142 domain-containing protein [Candidatus Hydrogenedentota bacterium]
MHSVYVWQQQWSPALATRVGEAREHVDAFMVLAALVDLGHEAARLQLIQVDWGALARTGRPTWAVLRAHVLKDLDTESGLERATESLADAAREASAKAQTAGLALRGIQIDYDCPTEGLADYVHLMMRLRTRLPELAWSITALPDWLRQPEMAALVRDIDHFVLQAHSLEKPRSINDTSPLCDPQQTSVWVKHASWLDCPFLVALPTYGYRMFYSAQGEFIGLAAEGNEETYAARERQVFADPQEMAGLVQRLNAAPPPHCRGVTWFRLPVEGDRLNWSWPVLRQVMSGQSPPLDLHVEVRTPAANLYEIWLANNSGYQTTKPIRIPVDLIHADLQSFDALNHFTAETNAVGEVVAFLGPASKPGPPIMVAWLRLKPEMEDGTSPLKTGSVEIIH